MARTSLGIKYIYDLRRTEEYIIILFLTSARRSWDIYRRWAGLIPGSSATTGEGGFFSERGASVRWVLGVDVFVCFGGFGREGGGCK